MKQIPQAYIDSIQSQLPGTKILYPGDLILPFKADIKRERKAEAAYEKFFPKYIIALDNAIFHVFRIVDDRAFVVRSGDAFDQNISKMFSYMLLKEEV